LTARIADVYRIFPILNEKKDLQASGLSGGQQQMLAIGRGLMLKPSLLLLDEPSLGLSPLLVTEIFRILATLRETGVSILLSEQNAKLSLAIADRGYVIETGKIVREGTGADLLNSSDIMERYLGVGASSIDLENDPAKDELTRKLRALVTRRRNRPEKPFGRPAGSGNRGRYRHSTDPGAGHRAQAQARDR
jgi:ABC-type multidrug transport system ATPase subunit